MGDKKRRIKKVFVIKLYEDEYAELERYLRWLELVGIKKAFITGMFSKIEEKINDERMLKMIEKSKEFCRNMGII